MGDSPKDANVSQSDIINLPSGKVAYRSRPSLAGLKKFSEIEELNNVINISSEKKDDDEKESLNTNYFLKWSIGLIIVGVIGGFGYYYVDRKMKENKNNSSSYFWSWPKSEETQHEVAE